MAEKILFSYGIQSLYDALTVKDPNTLYCITDTQRIYKGSILLADKTNLNVTFTDSIPEAASSVENMLYIATVDNKTTMWIKSGAAMIQAGGGEATELADGIITISKFATETLSKSFTTGDDNTIPTTKAVVDAITTALTDYNGAFVDVTTKAPETGSGTVIEFTAKDGSKKEVTIADIFLASASYDSTTHILTLTLNDTASSKVEVNLEDLIGNSLSDVKVGEDEAFTVELGTNGTLGGFKTGDSISKDMTVENIVKKLLMKQVPPTYTQPTVSIANNSGSSSGSYEIGTTVTPKVKATFTKNDAGDLTSVQFKKNNTDVGTAGTELTHSEDAFILSTTTYYSATISYAEGTIKNDNLGEPYPTGHITAGSKTTSNYTFTPYRQGYFIGTTNNTTALTSDDIRALSMKKNAAYAAGTVKLTVPVGAQRVIIACPATNKGMTKVLNESALNADVTSTFTKSTIDVEGAAGYEAISYNVWIFIPDVPYGQEAILAITLG